LSIDRINLKEGYSISRVIKGGWHLAGGHGSISAQEAIDDMLQFVKAGVTTFDCADIYTGVESLIGKFLKREKTSFRNGSLPAVQVHTKYVPDYDALATLTKAQIESTIDRSLTRLGLERLDLVQFAWWDYNFPKYVETALHLQVLQNKGKIRYLGVTNFDGMHLQEMLDVGVNFISNQVQYSVLDQRVEKDYDALDSNDPIPYLCYGVIAGGFLSEKYLGKPEPKPPFENRSLTKYRLIIEEFGSYDLFQELLRTLGEVGKKYNKGVAEVAANFILQKQNTAAIIVGARNNKHLKKLSLLSSFKLDENDLQKIQAIIDNSDGPSGPFYELERDKTGKHGAIMKYNLNSN